MKKWMIALSCILLVMSLTACKKTKPAPDTAETPQLTENPKTDFEYEVSDDGKFVHITKYVGTSQNVVVPSQIDGLPVTSLKSVLDNEKKQYFGPFAGSNVQSIVLPEGLQTIGSSSFIDCSQLTWVTFPKSLQNLSTCAFTNCVKLDKVDLSETQVEIIWEGAFYRCSALTQIQLPAGLARICDKAFSDCTSLTEIQFPDSLTRIDAFAFRNCTALKSVTIPTELDVRSPSGQAFINVPALEKIIFKEGREAINGYAFFDTTEDVEIIIPKSVKEIETETFFIRGPARIIFQGDCPEIKNNRKFHGEPTIFYDPATKGWDTCIWKDQHPMQPISNP